MGSQKVNRLGWQKVASQVPCANWSLKRIISTSVNTVELTLMTLVQEAIEIVIVRRLLFVVIVI